MNHQESRLKSMAVVVPLLNKNMEYVSIEELLSTPAEEYFDCYLNNKRLKNRILHWLHYASDEIIRTSRKSGSIKDKQVLISDIIQISERKILCYRCMGRLTVKAMNSALGINGLSLNMHLNQIAALYNNNQDSDNITLDKVSELARCIIQEKEKGTLCINLGKEIFPGYECTLNFRKL